MGFKQLERLLYLYKSSVSFFEHIIVFMQMQVWVIALCLFPVGFFNGRSYQGFQTKDSASPFGLYDMAGNVWQWVGDDYESTHLRYLRGGSKADYAYNLRVWMRNSAGPDYASSNVGFRCVR